MANMLWKGLDDVRGKDIVRGIQDLVKAGYTRFGVFDNKYAQYHVHQLLPSGLWSVDYFKGALSSFRPAKGFNKPQDLKAILSKVSRRNTPSSAMDGTSFSDLVYDANSKGGLATNPAPAPATPKPAPTTKAPALSPEEQRAKDSIAKQTNGVNPYIRSPFNNPSSGFEILFRVPNKILGWRRGGFSDLDREVPQNFATFEEAEKMVRGEILDFIKKWRDDQAYLIMGWDKPVKKPRAPAKPKAPAKPVGVTLDVDEVTSFLKRMKTKIGESQKVDFDRSSMSWDVEPYYRERLDHYVGGYDSRDPDDDDYDDQGWDEDSWNEDYADPLADEIVAKLAGRFGKGLFYVDVGDKGFVDVSLTREGKAAVTNGNGSNMARRGAFSSKEITTDEVSVFLKSMKTPTGGQNKRVSLSMYLRPHWEVEPTISRRAERWEEYAWEEEFAGPLEDEVLAQLDRKFGRGLFHVEVDAKGDINVELSDLGRGAFKRASASQESVARTPADVLSYLRALQWNHLTSHWQIQGLMFYGDHLLFQRLYESLEKEVDTLAEKIVGTYGSEYVDPIAQSLKVSELLADWAEEGNPFDRALRAERGLQSVLRGAIDWLEAAGSLSLGMDDLLRTIANDHESAIYLLTQRRGGVGKAASETPLEASRRVAARHLLTVPSHVRKVFGLGD